MYVCINIYSSLLWHINTHVGRPRVLKIMKKPIKSLSARQEKHVGYRQAYARRKISDLSAQFQRVVTLVDVRLSCPRSRYITYERAKSCGETLFHAPL